MLAWRLVLGPVLIVALVGLFTLDAHLGETAPILWGLALLLGLRSLWEMRELFRARFSPNLPLLSICATAIVCANWWWILEPPSGGGGAMARLGPALLAYALSVTAVLTNGLARYSGPGKNLENLGIEVLMLSYVAVFVSLTVQLRWVSAAPLHYVPLASLVVAVKCGDTCAFFAGRAFGKRKLSPLISPGKTRAGAVGALCGAAAGSWLWLHFGIRLLTSAQPGPWYWAALYGLVLGLAGMLGDLAESLFKRDVGQKDSAPLLPGFGGLLDLLDSVLFTGPVAYLLWLILPLARQ